MAKTGLKRPVARRCRCDVRGVARSCTDHWPRPRSPVRSPPGRGERRADTTFGIARHCLPSQSRRPVLDDVGRHLGSSSDGFLIEDALGDEAQAIAAKPMLAFQRERDMRSAQLTRSAMARRTGTTRALLDRALNPEVPSTTLRKPVAAAGEVGQRVRVVLCQPAARTIAGLSSTRGDPAVFVDSVEICASTGPFSATRADPLAR